MQFLVFISFFMLGYNGKGQTIFIPTGSPNIGLCTGSCMTDMKAMMQTATPAQTWFTVAQENPATSVTLPAGVTYRWGTSLCKLTNAPAWTQITVTAVTTINPLSMATGTASFGFADPCLGTAKELDVLETNTIQTITVTTSGVTKMVTVPALPPTTTTKHCTYPAGSFDAAVPGDGSFSAPISVVVTCK